MRYLPLFTDNFLQWFYKIDPDDVIDFLQGPEIRSNSLEIGEAGFPDVRPRTDLWRRPREND
jgi:hypothetical protein